MDKKFLDKVVGQIISETKVDWLYDLIIDPFVLSLQLFVESPVDSYPIYHTFVKHCEEIYGLNPDEIKYVWEEYKITFKEFYGNPLLTTRGYKKINK